MEDAAHHDSVRATELTAHLKAGDVAVADRAYTDFGFTNGLDARGVLWNRRRLVEMLRLYGTASPVKSPAARPKRLRRPRAKG